MFKITRKLFYAAFSLVELMVTLIVISCIISALVPAITKKLKSQAITVGSGGGGGNTNLEFEQDCSAFGVDCALCFEDRCAMCAKSCEDDEFINTPQCICESCTTKSENCVTCTSKGCTKCAVGYGLSNIKMCTSCNSNEYSDGTNPCTICPENHYCNGSALVACPSDSYAPVGSISCTSCASTYSNCVTCNSSECLTCKSGYKLKTQASGTKKCIIASGSQVFTTAGEHSFTVPEGIEEISVTLVSGGAGGGGGAQGTTTNTKDFYSSTTWNVPVTLIGQYATMWACGGGGGAGYYYHEDGRSSWNQSINGGWGGAIAGVGFTMPTTAQVSIVIGAGGTQGGQGWGCNPYGPVDYYGYYWLTGGYGGGATYISGAAPLAPGGGGGYGKLYHWEKAHATMAGCAGEGAGAGWNGSNGSGWQNNIFASSGRGLPGAAGAMRLQWVDKYPGSGGGAGHIVPRRILSVREGEEYIVVVGAGGAGGAFGNNGVGANNSMVSKIFDSSGIPVLTSAPIVSSMGALGGVPNSTTASTKGTINNGMDGTTLTTEELEELITKYGDKGKFSNTDGGAINGGNGGNGGSTIIEGVAICSPGIGGTVGQVAGSDTTGFGGCGGGGGGAGAKGGAGAPGYVKISWGDE